MKTNFTKMFLTLAVALCTVTAFAQSDATMTFANGVLTITGTSGDEAKSSAITTALTAASANIEDITTVIISEAFVLNDGLFTGVTNLTKIYCLSASAPTFQSDADGAFDDVDRANVTVWYPPTSQNYSAWTGYKGVNAGFVFNPITFTGPSSGASATKTPDRAFYATDDTIRIEVNLGTNSVVTDWGSSVKIDETHGRATIDNADLTLNLTIKKVPQASEFSISNTSILWNGSPQAVIFSSSLTNAGAITVKYTDSDGNTSTNVPVNADTYAISVAVAEGSDYAATTADLSVNGTFEITRLDPTTLTTISTNRLVTLWNGEHQEVSLIYADLETEPLLAKGASKVKVSYNDNGGYDDTIPPVNAGVYDIYVDITQGTGYADGTGNLTNTFTISRRDLVATDFVITSPLVVDYDGDEKPVEVDSTGTLATIAGAMGDITVKYNSSAIVPSNAGKYPITISVTQGTGYNATGTDLELGELFIAKKLELTDLVFKNPSGDDNIEWDGSPQIHGITRDSVTFSSHNANTMGAWSVRYNGEASVPSDIGTYITTAYIEGGTEYKASSVALDTFHIVGEAPKLTHLEVSGLGSFNYDGNSHDVTVSVKSEFNGRLGTITVKYTNGSETSEKAPTEPGEYTVTAEITRGTAIEAGTVRIGTIEITQPASVPTIPRTVELLYPAATDGITISKPAGKQPVTSSSNFTFTITGAKAKPDVTVTSPSSYSHKPNITKTSDNSYTVSVYIVTNITLSISIPDVPDGNAAIEGTQIWSSGGQLYIASAQSGEARIYNLTGTQVKAITLSAGETVSEPLATGLYIITLNGKAQKIHVH